MNQAARYLSQIPRSLGVEHGTANLASNALLAERLSWVVVKARPENATRSRRAGSAARMWNGPSLRGVYAFSFDDRCDKPVTVRPRKARPAFPAVAWRGFRRPFESRFEALRRPHQMLAPV